MKSFLAILTLGLLTAGAYAQSLPPDHASQVAAMVRSLYQQVVAHETFGLYGPEWKRFDPYLSKGMRHRIALTKACALDFERQQSAHPPEYPEKSAFSMEEGLLSGAQDTESRKLTFVLKKTEVRPDGTFLVPMTFTQRWPSSKPVIWHVAVRVVMEGEQPKVDDLTFDWGPPYKIERFSTPFPGCRGARWVGSGKQAAKAQ